MTGMVDVLLDLCRGCRNMRRGVQFLDVRRLSRATPFLAAGLFALGLRLGNSAARAGWYTRL